VCEDADPVHLLTFVINAALLAASTATEGGRGEGSVDCHVMPDLLHSVIPNRNCLVIWSDMCLSVLHKTPQSQPLTLQGQDGGG